jgi:thiol-disulfide isomerase/thioredoxin
MSIDRSVFRPAALILALALAGHALGVETSQRAVAPPLTMLAADGSEIRLVDFRGKVVVLDVWATWCGPCIASQPHLSSLADRYAADGVVVLAVCANDSPENFAAWVKRDGGRSKFTAVRDPAGRSGWDASPLQRQWGVRGFPTVFVIDRTGHIVGSAVGGGDVENLNIHALLAEAGVPVDPAKLPAPSAGGGIVQRPLPVLVPTGVTGAGVPVAAAPPLAAPDQALFKVTLGSTKIGDMLPDFTLMVDGQSRRLSGFVGRPLVLCLVFNAIPEAAYAPKMDALVARYGAAYGVQTVVVKVNTPEVDYRAWLDSGPVSFLRGWDPAGRFAPTSPEAAKAEHPAWESRTLVRTLQGAWTGGTPAMPAYVVVSAEGKFIGWLSGHKWFEDGVANLLLHAGVPLAPEHRPQFVAPPDDFEPAVPEPAVPRAPQDRLVVGQAMPALEFTDLDGRRVSLADLRGRVVLIDFWATWCGPCKEEIPTVKRVYAAYHDKGFEVLGVALENAGLRPGDTPAQTAAKLQKAKKVLTDFVVSNGMPWPQHFDGKHWKNEISTRFGIGSIPAMLLIDQDGKLVATDARGEKLEAEVKRLLGL